MLIYLFCLLSTAEIYVLCTVHYIIMKLVVDFLSFVNTFSQKKKIKYFVIMQYSLWLYINNYYYYNSC